MSRMMRRLAVALLVLIGVTLVAPSVQASVPRYMLVSGSVLPQPVILDDWHENGTLYLGLLDTMGREPPAPREVGLVGRPYLEVSLFWNSYVWEPLVQEQGLGALLSHANGSERFYPAFGDADAVYVGSLDGRDAAWRVTPAGLAILARHGIPTRLDPPPAP